MLECVSGQKNDILPGTYRYILVHVHCAPKLEVLIMGKLLANVIKVYGIRLVRAKILCK